MRALAEQLGLRGRLIFTGLTHEMASIYAAIDLLVIASDTEGMPHVLLEAMSNGVPVVSTAVGGIPEVAISEQSALLVPAGDQGALVEAIQRIHGDPQLAETLAVGGREVAEHFTPERLVEGMEAVYRSVLSGTHVRCKDPLPQAS